MAELFINLRPDVLKMKTILVLGAGRSSSSLIAYLLHEAVQHDWSIVAADSSAETARQKIAENPRGTGIAFDILQPDSFSCLENCDLVISLLPPALHSLVAERCLEYKKHLLTASYVSDEMRSFDAQARAKDLVFLNECGLDPGIDHMSAMQIIDSIRNRGGKVTSFESFTGGLIAPDTDPQNPWRYKFTWNPRNVVMAGQGTAKFLQDGMYKYIPYQQLFQRTTPVHVDGLGDFEGYANRDSLKYISTYDLEGIETMLRGTLRNKGFCPAWNVFVQLGCCDDTYQMEGVGVMTHAGFLNAFLPGSGKNADEKLRAAKSLKLLGRELEFLKWSGFFDDEPVGLQRGTPAQVLEHILNKRWQLHPNDKDQIVMWHRILYEMDGLRKGIQATLVATGKDSTYTAMAQTVGLPLGIAAKLVLQGRIREKGVLIPTLREIYEPVLNELKTLGIELKETAIR
jgi:saccharopine dehydrogenase-like NADP-dependent oxidoreductase